MKKNFLIYSFFILLSNSCGQNEVIRDPSFRLNLVINNPAQFFKISLTVCRHPSSDRTGLFYIQRIHEGSSIPIYRERDVVRRSMLDTVTLGQEAFEKFVLLIKKAKIWDQENSIGTRTDGKAYQFTVRDSLREHAFSIMGDSDNKYLFELAGFCLEQFELHYPRIPMTDINSEIDLRKYDRLNDKIDSLQVRIICNGNVITVFRDKRSFSLSQNQFLEIWQVLENNHIWEINDKTEFETKYPVEYRLSVNRGDLHNAFVVYAPSKLSDKRYFDVTNCIESLKFSDLNESDISK